MKKNKRSKMTKSDAEKIAEGMRIIGENDRCLPTVIIFHPEDLKTFRRMLPEFFGKAKEEESP